MRRSSLRRVSLRWLMWSKPCPRTDPTARGWGSKRRCRRSSAVAARYTMLWWPMPACACSGKRATKFPGSSGRSPLCRWTVTKRELSGNLAHDIESVDSRNERHFATDQPARVSARFRGGRSEISTTGKCLLEPATSPLSRPSKLSVWHGEIPRPASQRDQRFIRDACPESGSLEPGLSPHLDDVPIELVSVGPLRHNVRVRQESGNDLVRCIAQNKGRTHWT